MKKIAVFLVLLVVLLGACSSKDKETSMKDLQSEAEDLAKDLQDDSDDKGTNGSNQSEDGNQEEEIPVLDKVDVNEYLMDTKLTTFKDLDDQKKMLINDKKLAENIVYYGNRQALALEDSKTILFDFQKNKTLWESNENLSSNNIAGFENGKVYFSAFESIISLDMKTGKVVDRYPTEKNFADDQVQMTDHYISGAGREDFHIINKDTKEKVSIPFPEKEYYKTILMDNTYIIQKDDQIISFDNETGDKLGETEIEGIQAIGTSGNDDLFVFSSEDKLSYGYIAQKIDAKTLETKKEVNLKNGISVPIVTNNAIYFTDASENDIVAIDPSLEKELWRFNLQADDYDYGVNTMLGDEQGVHVILSTSEDSLKSIYLNLKADNGSVLNFVKVDHLDNNNGNLSEYYLEDGKAYIRSTLKGKQFFQVISSEDVHRPFPSK